MSQKMSQPQISQQQKKQFCIMQINNLDLEDKLFISNKMMSFVNNASKLFVDTSEGFRVNLDDLSEEEINNIYNLIYLKVENNKIVI